MENSKVILTKQEIQWHFINDYLEALSGIVITQQDSIFNKMLKNMQDYVDSKLTLNGDGEVIDMFVLVLQQSK